MGREQTKYDRSFYISIAFLCAARRLARPPHSRKERAVVALVVCVVATLFGYGVVRLFGREPFTTADLGVGALAGLGGLALTGGSVEGALVLACLIALGLQTLRRRTSLERVE
jgi:multisubunit Na+/H+ antiporter MnhB subunit